MEYEHKTDGFTHIKFHIDFAAKKIINQVMLSNEETLTQIEDAINQAVKDFDFKTVIYESVNRAITEAIKDSTSWSAIRQLARSKADKIVEDYIEKELSDLRKEFDKK